MPFSRIFRVCPTGPKTIVREAPRTTLVPTETAKNGRPPGGFNVDKELGIWAGAPIRDAGGAAFAARSRRHRAATNADIGVAGWVVNPLPTQAPDSLPKRLRLQHRFASLENRSLRNSV
jgi:hypothetical protein